MSGGGTHLSRRKPRAARAQHPTDSRVPLHSTFTATLYSTPGATERYADDAGAEGATQGRGFYTGFAVGSALDSRAVEGVLMHDTSRNVSTTYLHCTSTTRSTSRTAHAAYGWRHSALVRGRSRPWGNTAVVTLVLLPASRLLCPANEDQERNVRCAPASHFDFDRQCDPNEHGHDVVADHVISKYSITNATSTNTGMTSPTSTTLSA
ncbi:hypothetical protein B0H15DRAFT_947655 [Mycena belliarum]|uniref:Uncharacterized protein n=1 Tax=Mycena belliarum TaxID=1033014 RepID=A0AAD6XQW0_9AGAR|nr:hypothetical protein B0H15DRAFT_947655 [Mycena belliae]